MSTMASRITFAISASRTLLRLQPVRHTICCGNAHQQVFSKQISNAVSPYIARLAPTLTAVRTTPSTSFKAQRRSLQTEVDKELSKFLDKEINYEESGASKFQVSEGLEGFKVVSDGADVTMTRKTGNETVVVKFNVNASVDSEGPLPEGDNQAEMVSRPPFSVEVSKGDGPTLSMQCAFAPPEDEGAEGGPQDAEAIVDSFEIQEVALYMGEWKDTVYSVSADIMDGNLYDLLMDMLDERGINEDFGNQMVDYSTSYEHTCYRDFLKNLKAFVEK